MGGGSSDAGTSSGALPEWAQGPHQTLIGKAEKFTYDDRGGYVPYPDQRIAGFTEPEFAAQQARQDFYNRGDVAGQFAAEQLGLGSGLAGDIRGEAFREFTTDEMNRRMSPYMEGVIQPQIREANESYNRRLNQDEASSVARGGSIGSYRVGLENAFLEAERAQALSDIRARGQQQAYDQALNSFLSDRDARVGGLGAGVGAYQGLAAGSNALGSGNYDRTVGMINELERSGAVNRQMTQREMDLAYSDFLEERDFPQDRMSWLSSILSGVPYQQVASQTQTMPQPGIPAQLASLGLGAAGINQLWQGVT